MELERQRGISISSTVLRFAARAVDFNLLDTPGHADFSEDTYRTLWAADAAIVVIDRAKGIEPQTRKLYRRVPDPRRAGRHVRQQVRPARRGLHSSCSTRSRPSSTSRPCP